MFSVRAAATTLSIFALLALVPAGSAEARSSDDQIVIYRVKKGDSLYKLAQRHFRKVSDYRIVQQLNGISNPYNLPQALALRIPRRLMRFDKLLARVTSFRGSVHILYPNRTPVALGMQISEGQQIATGPNSFVTLQLADQSIVTLPSQSRIAVERMRRWSLTRAVERHFRMLGGRARSIVTPLNGGDEFDFSTPAAVAAVRGTEFRVSWNADAGRGTTEVLEGKVSIRDGDHEQVAGAGVGAVSGENGTKFARLLPAPDLTRPGAVQDEDRLLFEIKPVEGAASYHVQIARDAGFLDVQSETTSTQPLIELAGIADGTWFVRLSAFDAEGLEGLYQSYAFERRLNRIETSMEQRRSGRFRQYLFRWNVEGEGARQYRFQLSRAEAKDAPLIDEPGLSGQSFVVTDLPPGTYEWRVQTLQFVEGQVHSKWSPSERLTIADAR